MAAVGDFIGSWSTRNRNIPSDVAQLVSDADEGKLAEYAAGEDENKQQNTNKKLERVEYAPGAFRHLHISFALIDKFRVRRIARIFRRHFSACIEGATSEASVASLVPKLTGSGTRTIMCTCPHNLIPMSTAMKRVQVSVVINTKQNMRV